MPRRIKKAEPGNPTGNQPVWQGKIGDDPGKKEHSAQAAGGLKLTPASGANVAGPTLGELLYQQRLAEAQQPPPLPQPSANLPYAADPRDVGFFPPQQPMLPYATTATNLQPPAYRPPAFAPNVGVDTTAEIYPLPAQQQRVMQPMPPRIDYGPITTPIERPIQEAAGYIEPQQPYPFNPGPQIAATETFYEPEPVQGQEALPVDLRHLNFTEPTPATQPTYQDEVAQTVNDILPEITDLAPKTLDIYQEGPLWVEDPQAAAAQEAIDQTGFIQTDPSIYSPAETATVDTGPEIAFPEPIDYTQSYGDPISPTVTQSVIPDNYADTPEVIPQPVPFTPTMPSPAIPEETTDNYAYGQGYPQATDTDTTTASGPHTTIHPHLEGDMVTNIDNVESGPYGFVKEPPENTQEAVERQQQKGVEYLKAPIVDDKDEFKGDTVTGNIQGDTVEYDVDPRDFQDSRDLDQGKQKQQDPPLVDRSPDDLTNQGNQNVVDNTVTQSPVGGRKWLHTGPQDFAETRWQLFGAAQGDPIITHTPEISGPQVNPQTGEITQQPLSWWQNRPAGSEVSPFGKGVSVTGDDTIGAKGSPDVTGITPSSKAGTGGEGRTPFKTFLENQDNAGRLIPGGLNIDMAAVKGEAAINQLRNSLSENDFEGVDSFDKFGNLFEIKLGVQGVGNNIATAIQNLTGMSESDLKGPGLWNTLNTPIPALSTAELGITPMDIITVIAGGVSVIGPKLIGKFINSALQPITSRIEAGFKGIFDSIFKRGGGDVSQADINAADLAVIAEELGISKPVGMIEGDTYYGADGSVLATNMQPLGFGLHTVDGANSFKDVVGEIASAVDPNYASTKYNYETGQLDVIHADGTVTEGAGYITTDSDGNMSRGTSTGKRTKKKVNWGVNVVGVETIDTVAPGKGKGKGKSGGKSIWDWIKDITGDDDGDDDDEKPHGN